MYFLVLLIPFERNLYSKYILFLENYETYLFIFQKMRTYRINTIMISPFDMYFLLRVSFRYRSCNVAFLRTHLVCIRMYY